MSWNWLRRTFIAKPAPAIWNNGPFYVYQAIDGDYLVIRTEEMKFKVKLERMS